MKTLIQFKVLYVGSYSIFPISFRLFSYINILAGYPPPFIQMVVCIEEFVLFFFY